MMDNNRVELEFTSFGGRRISVASVQISEGLFSALGSVDGVFKETGEAGSHEDAIRSSLGVMYGSQAVKALKRQMEAEAGGGLERRG